MPARPENGDWRSDHGAQNTLPSTMYSQPWWQTVSNSASPGENASESSAQEHRSGSQTNGAAQHQGNGGFNHEATSSKQKQKPDGSKAQEHSLKMVPSSTPAAIGGRLEPNSNIELVGHSIVLSYPFSEQQYSGLLTSYGPQTLVTPQLYGMHHSRMPLPLEMEDEPVYVNAKQFHGIMRRRQARAKAELAKKAVKARKPYLHESRHRHAMRRARGCGGRFLSTKNQDNGTVNAVSDKSVNSTANLSRQSASLSGPERSVTGAGGMSASSDQQEQNRSMVHEIEAQIPPNGNTNGHKLSSIYQLSSSDGTKEGFMGQQKENAHGNGVSNRAQRMN